MRARRRTACLAATKADAGQAAEFLVCSDLLARQLKVTKPLNINGPHDVHFKTHNSWYTVQVRSCRRNPRTGILSLGYSRDDIASDIIAAVFLPTFQIRYIANKTPVPSELQTDLTILYGGDPCQSLNSKGVSAATKIPSASSRSTSRKAATNVAAR